MERMNKWFRNRIYFSKNCGGRNGYCMPISLERPNYKQVDQQLLKEREIKKRAGCLGMHILPPVIQAGPPYLLHVISSRTLYLQLTKFRDTIFTHRLSFANTIKPNTTDNLSIKSSGCPSVAIGRLRSSPLGHPFSLMCYCVSVFFRAAFCSVGLHACMSVWGVAQCTSRGGS
ncbi:hypothetical protein EVAR_9392_1 [Eumeta japonica]|uniref:Uncharacterized protein n=1 Tax=Eumeta variegata TaxID=151549 RepID=A0A4C1UED6_EUMVA|nr:hypothetical protein EVAR_9392_1 [Eumeta japonica]